MSHSPPTPPPLAHPDPVYTGTRSHSPAEMSPAATVRQPSPAEHIAFVDDNGVGAETRAGIGAYGSRPRASGANTRVRQSTADIDELPRDDRRQSTYATAQMYAGAAADRSLPALPMPSSNLIDYVVPSLDEKSVLRRAVGHRMQPTIDAAELERDRCAQKAKMTGWALNIAIGMQVLLGSLTTGLSAVASAGNIAVSTVILGGLSTLVASYLARARGSNEPELSITRTKDLEQFLRECRAFVLDHGHKYGLDGTEGSDADQKDKVELEECIDTFRKRFEELLGNANGERKLSPMTSV